MLPEPAAGDPGFARSVGGIALLVRYAAARGLTTRRALAGTGLTPEQVDDTALEVTATQELRVIRTLRAAFGEVGADVGARYRLATFGPLGYAIGSGRTLAEAMDVALRFIDLSYAFAIPRAVVVGRSVQVHVDGSALPADVRRFCVERDVTAVRAVLDSLLPGGVGATLRLDLPVAVLEFDVAELDRPLPRSGSHTLSAAEELCATVVGPRREGAALTQDVRVLVTQLLPDGAPAAAVASALGLSERTLRRRLADEGTTFQRLLDEVRAALAAALLGQHRSMSVAEVATRLGYAGATPFIAAHRRWTGHTPRSCVSESDLSTI